jgi:diguanylate cyclase (GGDEF)-like protein
MLKKEKKDTRESEIAELEHKVDRLKSTVDMYKRELQTLNAYKAERQIYQELSTIFASAEDFDDLFKRTMDVLSEHLKARYYGVFWLNDEKDIFEYRYGKGYKPQLMSAIPRLGSLMGECLYRRESIWIPDVAAKSDYIPLNQEPREHSILCAPLVLFGEDTGIIRLANIDKASEELGIKVFKTVLPLLCASLERMQLFRKNTETLRGLEASFTIARLLENTLGEGEILKKVCLQVPKLFSCKACIVAVRSEDDVKPAYTWPEQFCLGGNPQSSGIYLRNLLGAFPAGTALIKNIHRDRRWAWPQQDVRSLCMVGLTVQGILKGVIIAVGPYNEIYNSTQQSLLGLVATQTSITLERASYFRKQEELASHDSLTGLMNHRMFQEYVRSEIERMKRYQHPFACIMFDIDHFKRFNDTYGHPVGDEIIKMVSRTVKGVMRKTDRAFRYGGEEFCIICTETPAQNAICLAERLRDKIRTNRAVRGLSVTVSLGITEYRIEESPEAFIERVDRALYTSKDNGRNKTTLL